MPTWKIDGYHFYFHIGEILKKYEPAHVHVETENGEVEFWLVPPNTKTNENVSFKGKFGSVSKSEREKIKVLVKENRDIFLSEWNRRKKGV